MNDLFSMAIKNGLKTIFVNLYGYQTEVPIWTHYVVVDEEGWVTAYEHFPIRHGTIFVRDKSLPGKSMVVSRLDVQGRVLLYTITE